MAIRAAGVKEVRALFVVQDEQATHGFDADLDQVRHGRRGIRSKLVAPVRRQVYDRS